MNDIRIALAQINTTVGDIEGNSDKVIEFARQARAERADLVLFPELTLTGYPPEDLLFHAGFVDANRAALERVRDAVQGITAIVGFAERQDGLFNAAAILRDGRVAGVYRKQRLPNYGVFDERRYFDPGAGAPAAHASSAGVPFGVTICEDLWDPAGPGAVLAGLTDVRLIVNLSASPYHRGKWLEREGMLASRASDYRCALAFCNLVGGQDELVFDGHSAVFDEQGQLLSRAKAFDEDLVVVDLPPRAHVARVESPPQGAEEVYRALVLGTRDYVCKNGHDKVLIGISGGVDSALVACIACDSLGRESVNAVFLPSRFTSDESRADARAIAENLGIPLSEIDIQPLVNAYEEAVTRALGMPAAGATLENIQARIRGTLWMALANQHGWLVLTTGNKTEMALGYATLYGDMAGAFAVIKDVPKTLVYELAHWRNERDPVLPARVLTRAPTAELRPGQRDEDDLPAPYAVLDPILQAYIEEDCSVDEIARRGYPRALVRKVIELVDRSEFKRRQAPVGVKITPRAFGRDRRRPITSRFGP